MRTFSFAIIVLVLAVGSCGHGFSQEPRQSCADAPVGHAYLQAAEAADTTAYRRIDTAWAACVLIQDAMVTTELEGSETERLSKCSVEVDAFSEALGGVVNVCAEIQKIRGPSFGPGICENELAALDPGASGVDAGGPPACRRIDLVLNSYTTHRHGSVLAAVEGFGRRSKGPELAMRDECLRKEQR